MSATGTAAVRWSTCTICGGAIGYVECPTGGWWSHAVHPADDHDAENDGSAEWSRWGTNDLIKRAALDFLPPGEAESIQAELRRRAENDGVR